MDSQKKPGNLPLDDDMANELEILRLMQEFQSDGEAGAASPHTGASAAAESPAAPSASTAAPDGSAAPVQPAGPPLHVRQTAAQPNAADGGEAAVRVKRSPKEILLNILNNVIPKKGDPPLEIVRKCIFIVALIVLIGSVSYIINDMVIIPSQNASMYNSLEQIYDPEGTTPLNEEYENYPYPEGMDDAFKNLYPLNTDLRGWISYHSNASNDFLKIEYPVMYSGDNEKYLTQDFYNNTGNKNGALFFDERNSIESPEDHNKVTIIYGHNMASGQMFSGLNKFINSVYNVRSAPIITMNTLYHRNQYKVFAIIMADADENHTDRFNYIRTQFSSDEDFLNFVNQLRARSMYDFNSVDVQADDDLLILSTCTNPSTLDEGRLAVIARRVRDGESATVDTRQIAENSDVIMPKYWYEKHNETMHSYYTDENYTIPSADIPASGTTTGNAVLGTTTDFPTGPSGGTTGSRTTSAVSTAPTSGTAPTTPTAAPPTSSPTSGPGTVAPTTGSTASASGSTPGDSTEAPTSTDTVPDTSTGEPTSTDTQDSSAPPSETPSETPSEPTSEPSSETPADPSDPEPQVQEEG